MKFFNNQKVTEIFLRSVMIFCVIWYFVLGYESHLGIVVFVVTSTLALIIALLVANSTNKTEAVFFVSMLIVFALVVIEMLLSLAGYSLRFDLTDNYFWVDLYESVCIVLLGTLFLSARKSLKMIQPS